MIRDPPCTAAGGSHVLRTACVLRADAATATPNPPASTASRPLPHMSSAPTRLLLSLALALGWPTAGTTQDPPAAPGGAQGAASGQEADDAVRGQLQLSAYPLGGYASLATGRVDQQGRWDAGQGVLQLVDGQGQPIALQNLGFGPGPQMWVSADGLVGDVPLRIVGLGLTLAAGQDKRVVVAAQMKLSNPHAEARSVTLAAEVRPGSGSPLLYTRPFAAADAYSRSERLVLRNENVFFSSTGLEPTLELASPASADEVALRSVWHVVLAPGQTRLLEWKLVGPPAGASHDETAFRTALLRRSYALLEEDLRWQGQDRGSFLQMEMATPALVTLLGTSVHLIRLLGESTAYQVVRLTDRPYGQPLSDPALEPQLVACLVEFGMGAITVDVTARLVADLPAQLAAMSPEQQVAHVHGLARCLRMVGEPAGLNALADAIEGLGDPEVPVPPWCDPADVGADLRAVLALAGRDAGTRWQRLQWAEPAAAPDAAAGGPDAFLARVASLRRALSERRGSAAWSLAKSFITGATPDGFGSLDGHEVDGRFALAVLTLMREMFIDDHGPALELLPGNAYGIMATKSEMATTFLPTVFGHVSVRAYHVGPRTVGAWIVLRPINIPPHLTLTFPEEVRLRGVEKGQVEGGQVSLLGDRQVELVYGDAMEAPRGLRFQARIDKR